MSDISATSLRDFFLPFIKEEAATTEKVFRAVPNKNLDYRPDPKAKSALELVWHIASSDIWFLSGIAKADMSSSSSEPTMPPTLKTPTDIAEWYRKEFDNVFAALSSASNEILAKPTSFFGLFNYPAAQYFVFALNHTTHHRGQLSTYIRPMGGKVPSIYGGSADEPFVMPE